ncbi:hypothetical protein QN239_26850 [Mycolicibacterium sp. Y3]
MCTHKDIYLNGVCRDCDRDKQARYRRRRRLAMAMLHAAEARGFAGYEVLSLVQHVDIETVQECAAKGFRPAPDFDPKTLEFQS